MESSRADPTAVTSASRASVSPSRDLTALIRTRFRGEEAAYSGVGFAIEFARHDPVATVRGEAAGPVDLRFFYIMDILRESIFESGDVNWVNCG